MLEGDTAEQIAALVSQIRPIAAQYYRLTGKPLGVTGEIAEHHAANLLKLELAPARTSGFDAIRRGNSGIERIQIKGRAISDKPKAGQRLGTIKRYAACDVVMLVLLSNETLEAVEIWEASMSDVLELLNETDANSRKRGSLAITTYKRKARRVWP